MLPLFDIVRNFAAIMAMMLFARFLAWVGVCLRVYIDGGPPALETITKRKVHVVEDEIYAGAFLLCTMALGAFMQPSFYRVATSMHINGNSLGALIAVSSLALMLCWRWFHPAMRIKHPWRVVWISFAMAFVLEASAWNL